MSNPERGNDVSLCSQQKKTGAGFEGFPAPVFFGGKQWLKKSPIPEEGMGER
jgi:hypothetical protein